MIIMYFQKNTAITINVEILSKSSKYPSDDNKTWITVESLNCRNESFKEILNKNIFAVHRHGLYWSR